MPIDRTNAEDDDAGKPSLRQRLHAATGDRDREADALAERAGDDVSSDDAEIAVRRAHNDIGGDDRKAKSDLAEPEDAEAVHEERST